MEWLRYWLPVWLACGAALNASSPTSSLTSKAWPTAEVATYAPFCRQRDMGVTCTHVADSFSHCRASCAGE